MASEHQIGLDEMIFTTLFFTVPFLPHNGSDLKMAPIIFAITSDWFDDVFWSLILNHGNRIPGLLS